MEIPHSTDIDTNAVIASCNSGPPEIHVNISHAVYTDAHESLLEAMARKLGVILIAK